MFFFLPKDLNNNVLYVGHTIGLGKSTDSGQSVDLHSPDILADDFSRFHPLDFARTPDGWVYMVDGLNEPQKWNGILTTTVQVGVNAPTTACTISASGSGNITGNYSAYVRFIDPEGNVSNLSPVSNQITVTDVSTITYTSVPSPAEGKRVIKKQILRNTNGQALTYYVDVDTQDLSGTTFHSTREDDELRLQDSQSLFSDDLVTSLSDIYGLPPDHKQYISFYQNRLWLYGWIGYTDGNVIVTNGSTTVTGVGTQFREQMANRYLHVNGASQPYLIFSVDESAQTLTLSETYSSATNAFARYEILPPSVYRHLLYFSEPGNYDAWSVFNSIEIVSSDDIEDVPTGMVPTQSFLFLLQRRHIYRLSFLTEPGADGGAFLSARRGCINNRCWATADGFVYCLDDRGVYRFGGGDDTEDLSQGIQDIFFVDDFDREYAINWDASRWFHCNHNRDDGTIRWFVSLGGSYLPQHALAFSYVQGQWWIEKYPWHIGDSTVLKGDIPYSVVSGKFATAFALGFGTLDGVSPGGADVRGVVTAASIRTLTTESKIFPISGVVGNTLSIVDGVGKGQVRMIYDVTGQVLTVTEPWDVEPDTTSVWQIGGIPWEWVSGWFDWAYMPENQPRRVTMSFTPAVEAATMELEVFRDYSRTAEEWALSFPMVPADGSGVTVVSGETTATIDLQQEKGFAQLTFDGFKDFTAWRKDNISVGLSGISSKHGTVIYDVSIEGAVSYD